MKNNCVNSLAKSSDKKDVLNDSCETGLNIIDALDHVQASAFNSKLTKEFWEECSAEIDYLCERLDLNRNQVVLIAIMSEIGEAVSWRRLGEFIGLSRLKAMSFTQDLEGLKDKRWIYQCAARERGGMYDGFKLVYGIINAFRHNQRFEPEKIDGLSEQMFIDRLTRYVCKEGRDSDISTEENHRWMLQLTELNMHLPLCSKVMNMHEDESRIILLLEAVDYAMYAATESEGLRIDELSNWFEQGWEFDSLAEELQAGTQELFIAGILEHGNAGGMIDTGKYKLTPQAKNELLGQYVPHHKNVRRGIGNKDIIKSTQIKKKELFYNANEARQISRLKTLLGTQGYQNVQDRLTDSGLRGGITCLFYGAPGTGKTECVMQLARETGRDIMQVDLSAIRDKYVGESEKNIKEIFTRYKKYSKSCETVPILLFNEADAIINNRLETTLSSVDKMDNAIQNIILQELETLEGIMIATTNLAGTLDKAFDRRFLFKVEFTAPAIDAKKSIWHSMIPHINDSDCQNLAETFDFSGGQIENIARKCTIEYAITGEMPSVNQIRNFCQEESLNRNNCRKVGF